MLHLVIEQAPQQQAIMDIPFQGGQLVIGRSDEADVQLDDPEMYVSRRHCIVTEENGQAMVIDASSGGLFIDNGTEALGLGNTALLEQGMRLRMGDFILRVEMEGTADPLASPYERKPDSVPEPARFSFDAPHSEEPVLDPPVRPDSLPDPFGLRSGSDPAHDRFVQKPEQRPLDQPDPFELDVQRTNASPSPPNESPERSVGGGYFKAEPDPITSQQEAVPQNLTHPEPSVQDTDAVQSSKVGSGSPNASLSDSAMRDALFKGMGLRPVDYEHFGAEEIEAIGARMRDLVDGLVLMLRTRAQEKQKVRVAQTLMANANVNPLKTLVTTDEALAALISPRKDGYLPPELAVQEAHSDLLDHQMRTWSALQAALRRMIDRFDPEGVERELEDLGLLETIFAGGRSAKLWQLYEDRYREIARAAEEQFLGEVGRDFRDAYENQRRE